jgi:hypothetical protein
LSACIGVTTILLAGGRTADRRRARGVPQEFWQSFFLVDQSGAYRSRYRVLR